MKGVIGVTFQRTTFSVDVGPEVFLLVLEASSDAPPLAWPAELRCTAGVATMPSGPVAFLVWAIWHRGQRVAYYEQFMNPSHRDSLEMIEALANQKFLKAIMVDSDTSEVIAVAEFENDHVGNELVQAMRSVSAAPSKSFQRAVSELMDELSVEDLLGGA